MGAIVCEHVVKNYAGGIRGVDDLSLDVVDGELLVLFGPSGCGKTTTLRLIAGLERPDRGTIFINGRPVAGVAPKDRDVAMVFQHDTLYPHFSVRGNLAFGLRLRKTDRAEIDRRIAWAAELLGIENLLARRPWELSGGQRQRVALARAVVRRPRVFLLDEPLSSLDGPLRAEMRREMRRLHAQFNATTLYVTHDPIEALTLADRVAVLDEGRLAQVADPQTLYRRPSCRSVAALTGSPPMNFLPGRVEHREQRLTLTLTDGFTLPIPDRWQASLNSRVGQTVVLGLRPEHLDTSCPEQTGNVLRLPAEVASVEATGAEQYIHFRLGNHSLIARCRYDRPCTAGQKLSLALAADEFQFFDAQSGQAIGR